MRRVLPLVLLVAFMAPGTKAEPVKRNNSGPKNVKTSTKPYQVGPASWYGKQFDGRSTASGEAYDMFQLTAAHRNLPLGTRVKVTNLSNGESVVVRINDRGPVPATRIIDLSYAAAELLHLRAKGIQRVRLDVMPSENGTLIAQTLSPADNQ
jgi:rare lipoprotein A